MTLLVLTCLGIIALSFLASSMEAALFTVTAVRIEQMIERGLTGAERLRENKQRIQESIIAVVILNNLANIAGSILVGALASDLFNDVAVGVFSGGLTFAIIVLGEVVPKTVGERHAAEYARITAPFVFFLRMVFKPVILLIHMFIKPFGGSTDAETRLSEEEITVLARMSRKHGAILETEDQLIHRVFQLDDILAREIMTPRTVVFALPADSPLGAVAERLYAASVSRIPLYEDDLDNIVGVVHIRDVLAALAKGKTTKALREYADEVSFVPDTARANMLLSLFQKNREHLFVVVDEHGGMAGVITLEDVLEQLVGEIVDEHDRDVDLRVKARMLEEQRRTRRKGG